MLPRTSDSDQQRMWAYLPLPAEIEDIGNLEKWTVVAGDPLGDALALLREVWPFIGWESPGTHEMAERVRTFLDEMARRELHVEPESVNP